MRFITNRELEELKYDWQGASVDLQLKSIAEWLLKAYLNKLHNQQRLKVLNSLNLLKHDNTPNEDGKQLMKDRLL